MERARNHVTDTLVPLVLMVIIVLPVGAPMARSISPSIQGRPCADLISDRYADLTAGQAGRAAGILSSKILSELAAAAALRR